MYILYNINNIPIKYILCIYIYILIILNKLEIPNIYY